MAKDGANHRYEWVSVTPRCPISMAIMPILTAMDRDGCQGEHLHLHLGGSTYNVGTEVVILINVVAEGNTMA